MSPYLHLFHRYLRQQGLPVTQQREVVAAVVFNSSEHLSVEEIEAALKERGERIGKATIYRTLEILVRSGLVEEHDFGEGFKRYEHLFGQQPGHEHLICTHCGKVTEFKSPEVDRVQEEASRSHGFLPSRHRLEIYGLCADCQATGVTIPYHGLVCPVHELN
ncbi:MAG: transcriptional repressor [Gemmatimonadota bacterium]|jgi:Fur family ferric uptake transcriptional regulator|nr:transcriptional repressor [Gemmatimonadota bacterium]